VNARRVQQLLVATVITVLAAASLDTVAYAAWQAHGASTIAWGKATTMPSGPTPSASASGTSVTVSWSTVKVGGSPVGGYVVKSYDATTNVPRTVGASCSGTLTTTSCTETNVPSGSWRYTVTPHSGSWTGAESAKSAAVTVAGVDHFSVSAPSSATAGSGFNVTVTARNASNATLTTYRGTVHFSSSDAQATLPSDYTFTASDNGVHTFSNVTLATAGTMTVTVNDTVTTSATGSDSVAVSGAGLDHFTLTNPGSQTAGQAFTVTVAALDAYGNPASGWTSTNGCVTFSGPSSSPGGNAPTYPANKSCSSGTSRLSFDSNAQASASITLTDAGSTTLTVSNGTKSGTTTFTVLTTTAAKLAWTNASTNGTLSNPCLFTCSATHVNNNGLFSATVSVTDTYGNTVTDVGTGRTVKVTTNGGTFTAPTSGSSVTLTISATGPATSTASFTFDGQTSFFPWTDNLTAATQSGPVYSQATATVSK